MMVLASQDLGGHVIGAQCSRVRKAWRNYDSESLEAVGSWAKLESSPLPKHLPWMYIYLNLRVLKAGEEHRRL